MRLQYIKRALQHVTADSKKEVVSDFYSMIYDIYHSKIKWQRFAQRLCFGIQPFKYWSIE